MLYVRYTCIAVKKFKIDTVAYPERCDEFLHILLILQNVHHLENVIINCLKKLNLEYYSILTDDYRIRIIGLYFLLG